MSEKLSALMDDELTEFETRRVLDDLRDDPRQRATWERYHLARAALRNELDLAAAPGLAERIAGRLTQVPVRSPRPLRAAGTLAVAASVAAVAIIGVQWLNRPGSGSAAPVASQAVPAPSQVATRDNTPSATDTERTLNAYLVEHNEFATAGMRGLLPYVRVVGHDTGK
jgi:negative regulator of sigma E activity